MSFDPNKAATAEVATGNVERVAEDGASAQAVQQLVVEPAPTDQVMTRRRMSPLLAGSIGFLTGVMVWHTIGFWAFVSAVVFGAQSNSNTLLTRWVLGKSEQRNMAARARTTPVAAASAAESCITLTLAHNGKAVVHRPCPSNVASLVSRRVAQRGDRQAVHIGGWSTATNPAGGVGRAETEIVAPVGENGGNQGRWAPMVTGSIR